MATAEIQLTDQETAALHALAERTGKTPDTLLHEAVVQLLNQAQPDERHKVKTDGRLTSEIANFLNLAEKIQDDTQPLYERKVLLTQLSDSYHSWYRTVLTLFDTYQYHGERQKFEREYEGSIWSSKILSFLSSGLEINPFFMIGPRNWLSLR